MRKVVCHLLLALCLLFLTACYRATPEIIVITIPSPVTPDGASIQPSAPGASPAATPLSDTTFSPGATGGGVGPTPVPATPLPTIAPEVAATALSLYQQGSAGQGGDPNFRLIIPDIRVDSGIATLGWHTEKVNGQLTAVWDDPQEAVGYLVSSALPGTKGNTVMIGHNNIYGAVFKHLYDLEAGAVVQVVVQGTRYEYVVSKVILLRETGITPEQKATNLRYFDPTLDTRLTLLSCWPESSNTYRIVVIAKPAN